MVKISNKVLLAGGLATTVALAGCQKYDDGPAFSLLTKKQRLTGDWEITKWIPYGGEDYIDGVWDNGLFIQDDVEVEFDDDGDFDMRILRTIQSQYGYVNTYVYSFDGEWEFSNDKEEIELDFENGGNLEIEITRLTNKQFEGEVTGEINTIGVLQDVGNIRIEAEKD